jgi:aminopeptidase N
METTLEADARYTHLISNGNICPSRNPDGCPVPKPGDPSRQLMSYINPIPMAPYLFIAAIGTWDMLEDEIVYPSGKCVKLEYLVPPGRLEGARIPMEILKDSVRWQGETQEYEYRYDVYRTICMEKSNFGGMENVGNTTIVTSAALVDEWTGDMRLQYAHGVIVHEFEHNQCGSDVTMETPFDMWLNEGFTVDVERQYTASRFDPVCARLDEVGRMRSPIGGPLAIEEAGHLGKIVREGFNDPDELVDGVTYVKSAEVIRMLRCLLGPEVFRRAKNRYFERHTGGNATTDDFFACFEAVSGRDLTQFRKEWLYTIGYPQVSASYRYDAGTRVLTVDLAQARTGSGGFPVGHLSMTIAASSYRAWLPGRRTES